MLLIAFRSPHQTQAQPYRYYERLYTSYQSGIHLRKSEPVLNADITMHVLQSYNSDLI